MHIKQIEVINFKNIREFKADFQTGGIYLVTGENDIGKSHLIQAILTLLTGTRSDNNLTLGEKNGQIKMDVDDGKGGIWEVQLKYSEANPRGTLTIGKEGDPFTSDKLTALQQIFNYTDFDAGEFLLWGKTADGRKRQVEVVKNLLPKDVLQRMNELDQAIAVEYTQRTEHNRDVKTLETAIRQLAVTDEMRKTYTKKMDPVAISKKLQKATDLKADIDAGQKAIEVREANVTISETGIAEYQEQIRILENKISIGKTYLQGEKDAALEYRTQVQKDKETLAGIDVTKLTQEIKSANEHNEKCDLVIRWSETKKSYDTAVALAAASDEKIKKDREEKEDLIANIAKLPVAGLDFTEDGLTLHGVPFLPGEISSSQEMEVAVRLIIASNPKTKVFKMMHGESMGSAKFQALVEFAKKHGYQGFIEVVKAGQNDLIVHEYQEG
jgi:hypothetical protein